VIGPRLGSVAFVLVAALASAAEAPTSSGYWETITTQFGLTLKWVSNLGGGADGGQVWIVDLEKGEQRQIASTEALAWPVLNPDGSAIFALRGGKLIRVTLGSGEMVPIGTEAGWRKLIGVDKEKNVIGLVAGTPFAQPAVMTSQGELHLLPQPETAEEQKRVSFLLQEDHMYTDGRRLMVKRSRRGGRGYDISLISDSAEKYLSDCGDDACGQPSLSLDGIRKQSHSRLKGSKTARNPYGARFSCVSHNS
jgi:hypothetical protein